MSSERYWEDVAKLENNLKKSGDAFKLLTVMQEVMTVEPGLLECIFDSQIQIALDHFEETRTDFGEIVYPVEIAIRHLAQKINFFDGRKDPLSPESWSSAELLDFLHLHSREIAVLAGTHKISVNLPHRSAHIFAKLSELGIGNRPLFIIELGASGGFILSGLLKPSKFKNWAQKSKNFEGISQNVWQSQIFSRASNQGFGVDLSLPDTNWVISCTGDDLARQEMVEFASDVGLTNNLLRMNALDLFSSDGKLQVGEVPDGHLPVVVCCAMLYQLPTAIREELEQKVQAFILPLGGMFVVTNQARCEGYPPDAEGSISFIKDGFGNVISPKTHVAGNKMLLWTPTNR